MATQEISEKISRSAEVNAVDESDHVEQIQRSPAIEVDNYHGFSMECILVYSALLFLAFAQMTVIVSSGNISRGMTTDIGGVDKQIWFPQTVTLINVATASPISQAADYWGRKWLLVVPCFVGAAGSLVVSRAENVGTAIIGNILASVSTCTQPLLFAVASEILPRRLRPAAQGGLTGIFAVGAIVALLSGGALIRDQYEGWRIMWYIITALLTSSGLITLFFYHPPPRELQVSLTFRQKWKALDTVGITILPVGLTLFVMSLTWYGNPYPFGTYHVLAPFITGLAILAIFILYESWLKKDGLLHHGLFQHDRNFAISSFLIFIEGVAFFAANQFFPYEISVLFETDPVRIGLRFCIAFIANVLATVAYSIYCSRYRQIRWPAVLSYICFVIFYATMASADENDSKATWVYPAFLGIGLGGSLTVVVTAAQFSAPPALISLSSGTLICLRALGASVGLPVYNAIFTSQITDKLAQKIASAVLPLGLSPEALPGFIGALNAHDDQALASIPSVTPEIIATGVHGLKVAYVESFRAVHLAALVLSVIAVFVSYFLIDPKADFTMHVDAPLEKSTTKADKGDRHA